MTPATNATNGASDTMRMESVRVPSHIDEASQSGAWFRLGPIMTTILLLGLAWIGVVAWLVSAMPDR